MKNKNKYIMLNCPFCNCKMTSYQDPNTNGWRWFGEHKALCILENNNSDHWTHHSDLIKDWNKRSFKNKDK